MSKKILILGAGTYQVPLIKKAKELGLYTIVSSIPGNYPGFELADKVYYANTTAKERILEIAREEKIDGICTTGTDVAVITIGYVCDEMGLHGISYKSAQIATDKAVMKKVFKDNGVPTAEFYVVSSVEEALEAFDMLTKPVMMKIVDKSGSRGIYRIDDRSQIEEYFDKELSQTSKPYVVLEEYINGHEVGVDAIVQGGEMKSLIPHDKLMYKVDKTTIPVGHIVPYEASDNVMMKLEKAARDAINAMELNNCAVNMDVFVSDDASINIIEVGGRCGATGIPEVLGTYIGEDYYEQIIKLSLGEPIELPEYRKLPCASVLMHSERTGKLKKINVPDITNVKIDFDYESGHSILAMEDGTDRIGQAILWNEDLAMLKENIQRFQNEVEVEVEE